MLLHWVVILYCILRGDGGVYMLGTMHAWYTPAHRAPSLLPGSYAVTVLALLAAGAGITATSP